MADALPRSLVVLRLLAEHPQGLVLRQLMELQGDSSKQGMHATASTLVNQKCAGRVQYFKPLKWDALAQGGLHRISPKGCLWLAQRLLVRGVPLPQGWGGHPVQPLVEELLEKHACPPPPVRTVFVGPLEQPEAVLVTGAMRGEERVVRRTVARPGQVVVKGAVWVFGLGGHV